METRRNQELIVWDEEMQTNVNKGFCSPDDVLQLSADQTVGSQCAGEEERLRSKAGDGDQSGAKISSQHGGVITQCDSLFTSPLGQLEQQRSLDYDVPQSMPSAQKLFGQLGDERNDMGHKGVGGGGGPDAAELRSTLAHALRDSGDGGDRLNDQMSPFPVYPLADGVPQGICQSISEMGALMGPYSQDSAGESLVDQMSYGFDLSGETEDAQYTSLDPVPFGYDVTFDRDGNEMGNLSPGSPDRGLAPQHADDGGMVPIDGQHGGLQGWSRTELVLASLVPPSHGEHAPDVFLLLQDPPQNESSSDQVSKEEHRGDPSQGILSRLKVDCVTETEHYPDNCEPNEDNQRYLTSSPEKQNLLGDWPEPEQQLDVGCLKPPVLTAVGNCRAAPWEFPPPPGASFAEDGIWFTGKTCPEGIAASSQVAEGHLGGWGESRAVFEDSGSFPDDLLPGHGGNRGVGKESGVVAAEKELGREFQLLEPPLALTYDDRSTSQEASHCRSPQSQPVLMVPMGLSPTQNVAATSGQTTLSSSAGALSFASLQPSTSGESAELTSTLTSVSVSASTSSKATPQSPLGFEMKLPLPKDLQWPESSCGHHQPAGKPKALPLTLQSGQALECEVQGSSKGFLGFSASPNHLASDPSDKPEPDIGGQPADVSEIKASAVRRPTPLLPPQPQPLILTPLPFPLPSLLLRRENEVLDEARRREVVGLVKSGERVPTPSDVKPASVTCSPSLPPAAGEAQPDRGPEPRGPSSDSRDRAVSPEGQADCLVVSASAGEKGPVHRGHQGLADSYRVAGAEETRVSQARAAGGSEPALYTCTKCSVYFQEKEFLHRHMLDHFEGQGEDRFKSRARPYPCQECGHAFREPGALQKHLNLHQARRARFMEAIQELRGEAAEVWAADANSSPKSKAPGRPVGLCPSGGAGYDLEEPLPPPPPTYPADRCKVPSPSGHRAAVLATQHISHYACERCQFTTQLESAFLQHLKLVHQHLYKEKPEDLSEKSSPGPSKGALGSGPCPSDKAEISTEVSRALSRSAPKADRTLLSPASGGYANPWPVVFGGGLKSKQQVSPGSDGGSVNLKVHPRARGRGWRGPKSVHHTPSLGRPPEGPGPQRRRFSTARKSSSAARHPAAGLWAGDGFAGGKKASGQFSAANNSPLGNLRQPTHLEGAGEERGPDVPGQAKAPNPKAQGFRAHVRRARKRANPTSCNLRSLKKGTKEILSTLKVPEELPVAQHRQLLKMTPMIVMGGVDGRWECRLLDPSRESSDWALDDPRDRGPFWKQSFPGELPEELARDSEELLSRNLLRMFPLVERECPYCPDKFHTGIGLANHVRGHLKRVGISYNTRHFISAEEVTAIEKEFSLQKLKRRALKVRGGAVEKCNLCGAHFDSRAGMSSHARAHLRDLHVMTWSATSSPIDLLNELLHHLVPPGAPEPTSSTTNPQPKASLSLESPPTPTALLTSTDNPTLQRNKGELHSKYCLPNPLLTFKHSGAKELLS